MEIGVFIPIGNNGWLISSTSPQYMPSFAMNRTITQRAEHFGLDFVLSMIKLRGFGGKTEFWDHWWPRRPRGGQRVRHTGIRH